MWLLFFEHKNMKKPAKTAVHLVLFQSMCYTKSRILHLSANTLKFLS